MGIHIQAPTPELIEKENEVLRLRMGGMSYTDIAKKVGYADHTGAMAAYKRAIRRWQKPVSDEALLMDLELMETMKLALWKKVLKGEERAILTVLQMLRHRADLLGLKAPVKVQQEITTWDGDESIDRAVRDLAALLRANASDSASEGTVAGDTGTLEPIATGVELANLVDLVGAGMGQDSDRSGVDSLPSPEPTQDAVGSSSENIG